ncbi:MAG: hypothetical protein HYY93_05365 [Planctomycetes bacterium]|nr:hypothetical protein [Planctomycetota bacterium]
MGLLCLDGIVSGWTTRLLVFFGGDGHRNLAREALKQELVPEDDYKDLHHFQPRLLRGAASEEGHPSMFVNGAPNDSLTQDWQYVQDMYSARNFAFAYERLGIMGHLVQDMASPAHAFDIPHAVYDKTWEWPVKYEDHKIGDNMEWYADSVFAPTIPGIAELDDPRAAYGLVRTATRDAVNDDLDSPPLWGGPGQPKPQVAETNGWPFYWRLRAGGPASVPQRIPLFGESEDVFPGEYGPNRFPRGANGLGLMPDARRPDRVTGAPRYPEGWHESWYIPFLNRRLGDAVAYSSACWRAASRKLPPLLSVQFVREVGGQFIEVLENRKKEVDLKMFLDDDQHLIDDFDGPEDILLEVQESPTDPRMLPWRRLFPLVLPNNLEPGPHTLIIRVEDADHLTAEFLLPIGSGS